MEKIIDFLKYRYIAITLSCLMIVFFSGVTAFNGGLNYGIDFAGGLKIIAKFQDTSVNEKVIREALSEYNPLVQQIGAESKNEYVISVKLPDAVKSGEQNSSTVRQVAIKKVLNAKFQGMTIESEENVGPAIGDFLKRSAFKLFIIAVILMTFYLSFRFEFKYSIGAMVALLHDIAASVAFCGFAGVEINIPVVAALLTIYGYSVNDTIVIFDRIRENIQVKSKQIFVDVINKSITQSISRTILTSLTTLFSVLALYFLGGEVLNEFAKVLLFGILVGTYSSVYIASPVLVSWEKWKSK